MALILRWSLHSVPVRRAPRSTFTAPANAVPQRRGVAYTGSRMKRVTPITLPPFIDESLPPPEGRVSAFLLNRPTDLQALRKRMQELGCSTGLWQGQVLLAGSSHKLGQQQCTSVFLSDGSAICWGMSKETEKTVLEQVMDSPARFRPPARLGILETQLEGQASVEAQILASEEIDVVDVRESHSSLNRADGTLNLTLDPQARVYHQIGISLGLAVAVRLEALEKQIEEKLESDWEDLHREVIRLQTHKVIADLSTISHRTFVAENTLHELRYALNAEAGLLDAPELLWEHALAEKLYDQVLGHFEVGKRTDLLNGRLTYSLEYLHTLGEHVRHMYSVRLERMIVAIISVEMVVGLISLYRGLSH